MCSNKKVSLQYIKPFNGFLFSERRQHTSTSKHASCFGIHPTPQTHLRYTLPNCNYDGFISAPPIHHVFSQHLILHMLFPLPDYAFLSFPKYISFLCFVWNHHFGGDFSHSFYKSVDLLQTFITLYLFFIVYWFLDTMILMWQGICLFFLKLLLYP